jgi:hypothetical protein
MRLKNNTVLYLEGFNRYNKFLLEAAITETNLNGLFSNSADLTRFITLATVDQLRYFFYKIQKDLPDSEIGKFITEMIELTKNQSYNNVVNELRNNFANRYGVNILASNTPIIVKIYNSLQTPADLTKPGPSPLENFGLPVSSSTAPSTITPTLTSSQPTPPSQPAPPSPPPGPSGPSGGPGTPPPGPGAPTNLPPNREAEARGEQIRQGSTYRQQARGGAMSPISQAGGPTYYIRTSPGRYRPAVEADMDANIPLFIKNPNPVAALVNPYVRVSDEVKKARRAGPVDAEAIEKEIKGRYPSAQRIGPGGLRREGDGSIRRKSQYGGALGSISNFFGDVGNTVAGKGTSYRGK